MNQSISLWWNAKKGEVHKDVFATVRHIDQNQNYRTLANLRHLKLYGNADVMGLSAHQYARPSNEISGGQKLTFNVIQSVIDTAHSKIGKNRPRPMFLTDEGNWDEQRRAKKLNKYLEGAFDKLDLYTLGQKTFLASCVFDLGVLKFFKDNGEVKSEWVFPNELKWDDAEAMYGFPIQLHQTKTFNRETLKALYDSPTEKRAIDAASELNGEFKNVFSLADQVEVIESWKLPSKPGAKDGRHTICIDNYDFVDEPWEKDYFPFSFLRWKERLLGFAGQGLAERLTPIQVEMNRLLITISECLKWSVPKLFVENGSKVVPAHANNSIAGIMFYTGTKPVFEVLQSVSPELFAQLDRLYQRAFEEAGFSQLSAQGKKPEGLDSGKAIRAFNDIESDRHAITALQYEKFYMDSAKIVLDLERDLQEEGFNPEVKVKSKRFIESISWKDVDLREDQYIMQMYPTNLLPQTPAGKFQAVQELVESGFVGKEDGLKLLDFPDIRSVTNLSISGVEDMDALIERFLDGKPYEAPEPFQNLGLGIQKMQSAYLNAKNEGVPEEILELFRRWMRQAQFELEKVSQPPALPQQATPLAVPQQPPVSDLLPVETALPGGL